MNPTPHPSRPIGEPTLGCSGKGRSTDPSAFKRRQTYFEKPLPDQFPSRGIANALDWNPASSSEREQLCNASSSPSSNEF